ncbi:MAG: aldehyde dehydrogenase family protein [Gammaproteobacteria bacterium]|nr:aldehyde dehydrogenase family protein [Gammaproteobacteria bacterium]
MDTIDGVREVFDLQKRGCARSKAVPYRTRLDRLERVERLFRENHAAMIRALQADFGTRDPDAAMLGDIYSPIDNAARSRKALKSWMRPERRPDGFMRLLGQRSYVLHEPLGVVGVIAPFNAPVTLAFDPAIGAIAAGNTVMMRFPEAMPATGALAARLVADAFDPAELAVVTGDIETARFFSSLPWDLLVFTGGAATARRVMAAAAGNLTPVVLELGGKSPVVVLADADLRLVARKTVKTRLMNGGQVCIAGDYALVPDDRLEEFLALLQEETRAIYPAMLDNPRYTSVVGDAAYGRLAGYVAEARERGTRIIEVIPEGEALPDPVSRKFPLTIAVNPDPDLGLSREEIFGPILPVIGYRTLDDAIGTINAGEKPLALYVHGRDRAGIGRVLSETSSGGVTVNDFLLHAGSHSLGFGGVGESGMGRYKGGKVGFRTFSNPKGVFEPGLAARFSHHFLPPLAGNRVRNLLRSRIGLK